MESRAAAGPIRVLIISSHLKAMGGAEKNVLDVARGLKGRCLVEVAGLQCGPLADDFRAQGIPVTDLRITKILSPGALFRAVSLARRLRSEGFDLVVTYHHDADLWGGLAARLAGVPALSSRRDLGYQLSRLHVWLYRLLNRVLFRRIIAVSDAVKRQISRTQWTPPSFVVTIHNGLSPAAPATFDRAAIRRELGLDPMRPVIGTVGSFRAVKGQEFLVRAAEEVVRRRPDVQFVMAGDTAGSYFREVESLAKALGVAGNIKFLGSRADIARVLSTFDIFVLPSRQEGFSNALVEAMAAGIPVIASAVGGNPEAIDHGANGLLFDPGDHGQLARHILALLDNPAGRDRMSAAARGKVAAEFSYDGMIGSLMDLIGEVVRFSPPERAVIAAETARRRT